MELDVCKSFTTNINNEVSVGIDIGSISIKGVICNNLGNIIEELPYKRHFGRIIDYCAQTIDYIQRKYGKENILRTVFTGSYGKLLAKYLNTYFEIETISQIKGLYKLNSDITTIISIGGHDSMLLIVRKGNNEFILEDFKVNEACAAGTGSFIDQQAERVFADLPQFRNIQDPQVRIEKILDKFIEEGLKSDEPANVACRCTVFTKSDMIHLQNKGIAIKHIIAGLHEGVAKNFKSTLITNREVKGPIAFIGGYASNKLAVKSFEKILGQQIIVPPYHTSIGAYGVCLSAIAQNKGRAVFAEEIAALSSSNIFSSNTTEPLQLVRSTFVECGDVDYSIINNSTTPINVYMGLDIGSTTTKLVLIDENGKLLYKRYIPTEGQPVVAIKKAIRHAISNIDVSKTNILAVGATGSGREVAGLFVGADDIVNEVTAHACGTLFYKPDVDTIFELGGQDAKYTKISNGYVVDFKMNKVCAAGTGSFLEETANKLGISINKEYEEYALRSKQPFRLTERCTVYMESDLMSYLQMGASKEDLLSGLAIAVVHNYLNRVVQDGKIGDVISFQGGPSLNKAVVAAFEKITGKTIITLPHREVMGAIGAALHAKNEREKALKNNLPYNTKFRGWQIIDSTFSHTEEICFRNPTCHNQCKLQIYKVGNSEAIYGGECGLYESRQHASVRTPDFAKIRQNIFFKYVNGKYKILDLDNYNNNYSIENIPNYKLDSKIRIGIPRSLSFYQLGVAWITLFSELGFDVIITPETNNKIVNDGIASMTCEACFPVKLSHGHTKQLIDKCDYIFLPLMIEMPVNNSKKGYYCPYLEANTYMLKSALKLDSSKLIMPALYLREGLYSVTNAFQEEFKRLQLPFDYEKFLAALNKAFTIHKEFEEELIRIGNSVLAKLGDKRAIVVVGRPYSMYDSRTNLNLFATFSRLGFLAIPQDFLKIEDYRIDEEYPNMYWGSGQKILKAAKYINHDHRLFPIYLTSFSCGPDSFILHFFNKEMNKTNRPYLELELDEHSAGAGVETRLLAFIDVINNQTTTKTLSSTNTDANKNVNFIINKSTAPLKYRTIYIPKMSDGSEVLAAAFEGVGIKAKVLETYTKEGIEFGKRHTSGKECFPCTVTTGDMFYLIEKLKQQNINLEDEIAFFMPETEGPCRFGQYSKLHRLLLDKLGLSNIPIISPSSEDAYKCNGLFTEDEAIQFRKLGWQGIVFADLLEKTLWKTRPYEIVPGTADTLFQKYLKLGVNAIKKGGGLKLIKVINNMAKEFSKMELKKEQKPLIGIVGEIYVRTHKESNQNLVKTLESLGCETYTSSVSEWIEYTTHTAVTDSYNKVKEQPSMVNCLNFFKEWLTSKYQKSIAYILSLPIRSFINKRLDHPIEYILAETQDLFSNHINGEAILSIGAALCFTKDNFNGVINAMPFTCMPSTIASSILKVAMRNKIPYVDMVYDGTIIPNRETNLETFVYQAKQHMQKINNYIDNY